MSLIPNSVSRLQQFFSKFPNIVKLSVYGVGEELPVGFCEINKCFAIRLSNINVSVLRDDYGMGTCSELEASLIFLFC